MREIKEKIIKYLMDEYDELEATQQVCFAEIETVEVIRITYDNGVVEYVEQRGGKVINIK
jgi:hypothetical protein